MQVYNLCKYSILTNCIYKIPLPVLEGQSKYKDPRSLCSLIVDAASEEDKPFIELMVETQMVMQYIDVKYCLQDKNL